MFKFNLHPDEKLLDIKRQAEMVLAKTVLIVFALIYLPWMFLIKYDLFLRFDLWLIIWTLIVLIFALNRYLLWLINVYIFTDKRFVAINYKSIIHKKVLETPIDRIQNISFETKGFWRSILKIGNIIIQVASLAEPLTLTNLKNPEEIKDFLWKIHLNSHNKSIKKIV